MLKADINQIEPECIIDTEKFIQSLHKEFTNEQEPGSVTLEGAEGAQQ